MKKRLKIIIILVIVIILASLLALLLISEFKQTGLVQHSSNISGNETGTASLILGNAIKTVDYIRTSFVQKVFEYFFKRQPA